SDFIANFAIVICFFSHHKVTKTLSYNKGFLVEKQQESLFFSIKIRLPFTNSYRHPFADGVHQKKLPNKTC
ncbi:MAG: hypothetical protein IJS13_10525, partial [Paludibacteraceae bacterium]|nr:hypothetical protein [Paludibacteraceae bacterium]